MAQAYVLRKGCNITCYWWCVTFVLDALVSRASVALQATVKIRDLVWEIKYWDLRGLNNVNSKLFLQWNEYKRLNCDVFHCILVSVPRLTFFFWLYCINHFYSLHTAVHKTKSTQPGHSMWQGPGPVATRMLFSQKFESATNFSSFSPSRKLLLPL